MQYTVNGQSDKAVVYYRSTNPVDGRVFEAQNFIEDFVARAKPLGISATQVMTAILAIIVVIACVYLAIQFQNAGMIEAFTLALGTVLGFYFGKRT